MLGSQVPPAGPWILYRTSWCIPECWIPQGLEWMAAGRLGPQGSRPSGSWHGARQHPVGFV